jgi:glycosyltransferase involved in cell wall biosynthesis
MGRDIHVKKHTPRFLSSDLGDTTLAQAIDRGFPCPVPAYLADIACPVYPAYLARVAYLKNLKMQIKTAFGAAIDRAIKLFKDSKKFEELQKEAMTISANFSWDTSAERYADEYEKILSTSNP